MNRKVDFFIVGAPKCGTTALAEYLNRLPSLFIPDIKEPHYFCTDWPVFRRVRTERDYHLLYSHNSKKIKGDASVWYLYSRDAAENIKKYNPDAKIIIMLRRQVDAAHSLHSQLLFSGREDLESFADAWSAQKERKEGKRVPGNSIVREHLLYHDVYDYYGQVKRYFDVFGKEQCLVIKYEHFFANIEEEFNRVLDFLGVKESYSYGFERINQNRRHRAPGLAHFLMRPPGFLGRIKEIIKKLPFLKGKALLRGFYKKMSTPQSREGLDKHLQNEIMEGYRSSNDNLADLIGYQEKIWK
ncbi:sulfotransferase family protein [Alloalcanivorax xenomutans]|uniref:sulfotransferase family protein n=1 Tax=Alloalcanivorax xenomutans TaxID=1094342 RepID=UPI003BACFA8B